MFYNVYDDVYDDDRKQGISENQVSLPPNLSNLSERRTKTQTSNIEPINVYLKGFVFKVVSNNLYLHRNLNNGTVDNEVANGN